MARNSQKGTNEIFEANGLTAICKSILIIVSAINLNYLILKQRRAALHVSFSYRVMWCSIMAKMCFSLKPNHLI